jgi:hypothetical protein
MLAKRCAVAVFCFTVAILFDGCSTDYYTYTGTDVYQGHGGAAKNVNGIDIWLTGTPLRKFKIIGYITDSQPSKLIPMATRDSDLAATAKKNGGDGILMQGEEFAPSGNAIRREGQYFVIKYLD